MAVDGGRKIATIVTKLKTIHIYISVFIIGVAVTSGYLYLNHKRLQSSLQKASYLQEIKQEERRIQVYERDVKKGIHRVTYTCEYLLAIGDYKGMYNLAEKKNNKKYIGIYYVIINIPSQAIPILKQYIKKHPEDSEALAYLGLAYFKEKKYSETIAVLSKIKKGDYRINYDIAVSYEKIGDSFDAVIYYSRALLSASDPVYRNLIKEKILVLKMSGGKRWIFQQDSQ